MTQLTGLSALRLPHVRTFALGRGAAVLGSEMVNTAVGWELYERTSSAWVLGLVGAAVFLPVLLLIVPAGHAADHVPRRHLAVAAQSVLGLVSLGLALLAWGSGPTWAIFALLALTGVGRAFARPSVGALLPQLVPPQHLPAVNAWISSTFQLAMVLGPGVAGLLIAATGAATWVFALAAAFQLLFAALLWPFPVLPPAARRGADGAALVAALTQGPAAEAERARRDRGVLAGLRFVWSQPVFLAAITLDLFAVLLGGAVALLPVFARDLLQVGPTGLGWLRAAPGVGSLVSALALTHLPPWKRPGLVLLVVVSGFGLATIGFGLSTSLPLSLACLFLTGLFDSVSVVIRMTLEQALTPDALRGRVSAINYVFIGASNELGAFESGATAALFGPVASVVGGGIGTLLVVATVALRWPALRRLPPLHTLRP